MSAHCCNHDTPAVSTIQNLPRYRRALWIALGLNLAMFVVEVLAGGQSGSLSLLADAVDFAGDAINYGVSLAVLSAALVWRARAALFKAACMLGMGGFVLAKALLNLKTGAPPEAATMGVVAVLALSANLLAAWVLYAFREGDANMRSVWLCTRNDAIGNIAVMAAALGVFGTGSAWPDLLVAAIMASLALRGGWQILKQARGELQGGAPVAAHGHDHDHGHSH
ncbi:cation diffusion facilitator family transporter [Paucibacter sp. AS339]|uniref:cation diffusion facilitator family transporter n=1 Tax=Paucibacter hankyongi TaxID=3133434 RepID=UPI00309CA91B